MTQQNYPPLIQRGHSPPRIVTSRRIIVLSCFAVSFGLLCGAAVLCSRTSIASAALTSTLVASISGPTLNEGASGSDLGDDDDESWDHDDGDLIDCKLVTSAALAKVENCVPFDITSSVTANATAGSVTWSTQRMYKEGKDDDWVECGHGRAGLELRAVYGSDTSASYSHFRSIVLDRDAATNVTIHKVSLLNLDPAATYEYVVGSSHHGYSNLHRLGHNIEYSSDEAWRCRPVRVRSAYGSTPDAYAIQWSTPADCSAGTHTLTLEAGKMAAFTASSITLPATSFAFGSRAQHVVSATNLRPHTFYSYFVGNDQYSRSLVFTFRTAPGPSDIAPLRFLVTGDIGYQNAATLPMMQAQVARGLVDAVISVGDYAYDLHMSKGQVGDVFLTELEPVAANVPFMVAMGNHEVKQHYSHYTNRFQLMPANAGVLVDSPTMKNNWYYSYNVGLVHFVVLCTEIYFKPNPKDPQFVDRQVQWLQADLAVANGNRTLAPWVIVIGHRPLYCTSDANCDAPAALLRDAFEDLFYDMGVDLYLCGHQHNYERMYDVYRGATMARSTNMAATTYILTGAAGQSKVLPVRKPFGRPPEAYTAFRNTVFGFSRLVVHNSSHVQWQQIECDPLNPAAYGVNGQAVDDVWLVQTRHGSFASSYS
ncbi:hypothetical protein DYB26_005976 [Aphanomyces astaci]|uniref:Purple acid phosphatase n=1 Tax=Aphanomyces astaci TaxID=112090 RepID=A0A418DTM2_APHAT|nr:hypothetical protein DYB26_005976 [Aphanomyces astaci]